MLNIDATSYAKRKSLEEVAKALDVLPMDYHTHTLKGKSIVVLCLCGVGILPYLQG
jgi:hypothetical protein